MADGDKGTCEQLEGLGDKSKTDDIDQEFEGSRVDLEEVRKVGAEAVDEVISLAEKADELKEHDVIEEEEAEAKRLEEELDKELLLNDGWVKILGNDELVKKVLTKGEKNNRPLRGDICTVRLEGTLAEDDTVVFEKEDSFQFQLGDAEVIPGLDLSIPLMCKGEVATIKVAHRFGFGSKGLTPHVPPGANLVYSIELLDFETEKDLSELSVKERREIGNRKRERGNWWYGRGEASLAVQSYRRALEFLDEVEGGIQFAENDGTQTLKNKISPELKELFEDRLKALNNMAAAQLKLQAYEPALSSVESVLKCQPNNVKALFRKGMILGAKGETEKALKILHHAKSLDPAEKSISVEINRLSQRRKKEHQSEKQLYKRMFTDSPSNSEDKDSTKVGGGGFKSSLSVGLAVSGVAIAVAGVMAYRYRLV